MASHEEVYAMPFEQVTCVTSLREDALEQDLGELVSRLGSGPDWLVVSARAQQDHADLLARIRARLGDVPVHGLTSAHGIMSDQGLHQGEDEVGLWAIRDSQGAFGVGHASLTEGSEPQQVARLALERALRHARRPGEFPSLVFVTSPPGHEEALLEGLGDLLGEEVLIAGGSAADNDLSGQWKVFDHERVMDDAVLISVLFPSVGVTNVFEGGYEPTLCHGVVTRGSGRVLEEIDHRPAAEVYDEWSGGLLSRAGCRDGGDVLALTTESPIGRYVNERDGIKSFILSHPARVEEDGSMVLFTEITPGERLVLMSGERGALISRAARLVSTAIEVSREQSPGGLRGLFIIYCAGCLMHLGEDMAAVIEQIRETVPGVPFMGAFTFGEQGKAARQRNLHGNLMISVVAFHEE